MTETKLADNDISKRSNKSKKIKNKEFARSYEYFMKICDNIPDHIKLKLSKLPMNKGFIYNDVHLYGELDIEPDSPTTMFENKKNNILLIHEWSINEYRVYIKKGKNKKKLKICQPRIKK